MKVLNLYSGIGGNRTFWDDCEVTAVEIDPEIVKVYQRIYPNSAKNEAELSMIAATLGKKGGKMITEAKQKASQENGKKGGRPKNKKDD